MQPEDIWAIIAVVSFIIGVPVLFGWMITKHHFGLVDLRLQVVESRRKKVQRPTGRLGSRICWCYVHGRTGDPTMFECNNRDGLMSVMLHGYAIIPLEAIAYDDEEVMDQAREFAIAYMERESNQ